MQFRFPRWFTGTADVNEWYDDGNQQYRISVEVDNPIWGLSSGIREAFRPGSWL
ncbi:DUF4166 domain-containing protein [Paenibacillus lautus]|uniref:DUF4166 domain-containing protein n=1 Tax=Paenibacillus lautus TaxID=1401 RepID=UPI003D29332B